jgi:adenylate cyclase
MLYEILTGQPPFHADYEQTIVYLILNQEPEDVRNYRKDVPERLLNILKKSIAKYKNDRYENLTLMLEDLKNVYSKIETKSFEFEIPASKPSKSIAVLPFVNMSADPEQEYFCDGLTEELINALSKISDLRVVARTSAFAFKGGSYDTREAGRKLGVRTVLEGSVRKSGERLRITAQLINVLDGYHLWSEKYDRELKDVFDIQEEISLAIVNVLKVKLQESEKEKLLKHYTDNIEAYNLYKQGYYYVNQVNMTMSERAIEYFNQALAKDPNYALAYHGLAGIYFCMGYFGVRRTREVMPYVKKYTQKLLEIDENLSHGYDALGVYKGCFEWKLDELDPIYKHALELNPNDTLSLTNYGLFQILRSQFEQGKKLIKRALSIDPLYDFASLCLHLPDFCNGKYDRVAEHLSKYLGLNPPFGFGLLFLWRTFSLMGKITEAVEACKKSFLVMGMNDVLQEMQKVNTDNAFITAATYLADIYKNNFSSPKNIALLFIHAGKKDEALKWLEEAMEVIDPQALLINVEPDWQPIRNDPRFQSCLKKIGFIK